MRHIRGLFATWLVLMLSTVDTSAQKLAKLEALLSEAVPSAHDAMPLFAAMLSLPIDDRYRRLTLSPELHGSRLR